MNEGLETIKENLNEGRKVDVEKIASLGEKIADAISTKKAEIENKKDYPKVKEEAKVLFGDGFLMKMEQNATIEGFGSNEMEIMTQKIKKPEDVVTFVRYISENPKNKSEFNLLNMQFCLGGLKQKGGPKFPKENETDAYIKYENPIYRGGMNIVKKLSGKDYYANLDEAVNNQVKNMKGAGSYIERVRTKLEGNALAEKINK